MTFDPSNPNPPTTSTENTTVEEPAPTPTPAPTPEPAQPPANLLSAYSAVLGEKDQEIARLRAQVEQTQRTPEPTLTPEEQSKQFFETPLDLIRKEIANAVKPLNDFVAVTKRDTEYANLKTQMRADPRFNRLSEIEARFDAMMKTSPLDPNTMIGAYYAILGMMVSTGELSNTPTPTPTPTPASAVNTPAHLRPSSVTPAATPKPTRRQLTENEKRLARASNLTDDQYLDELEGPATLIVSK
jgi:hypothetical protein